MAQVLLRSERLCCDEGLPYREREEHGVQKIFCIGREKGRSSVYI